MTSLSAVIWYSLIFRVMSMTPMVLPWMIISDKWVGFLFASVLRLIER
jgi:hypothetical protein